MSEYSFDTKTATVLNSLLEVVCDLQHQFEMFEKQIEKIAIIQCTVNSFAHKIDDIENNLEFVMNRKTEMEGSIANMGHLMHKVFTDSGKEVAEVIVRFWKNLFPKFISTKDKEIVLKKGFKLKGTNSGVQEQFPKEIEQKRKIYPVEKQARREYRKVLLVRDKLYIDGNLFKPNNEIAGNEKLQYACADSIMHRQNIPQQYCNKRSTPSHESEFSHLLTNMCFT
ncbi:unnamed protein product [Mytilus coruscus]|uniref:Uncharacterized protein n=1 Tax=Mytilus coruscus TaxID=42192 RepID=A0A6J8B413_MYTCO|nr:unnamed protein product [Mytilus coruscus]